MAAASMLHVHLDEQVKMQATETLAAMGVFVSDTVRVFLMRVVSDKQLPFMHKAPKVETHAPLPRTADYAKSFMMKGKPDCAAPSHPRPHLLTGTGCEPPRRSGG